MFLKHLTIYLLLLTLIGLLTDTGAVNVTRGGTANLSCHSNSKDFERFSVKWIKNNNATVCDYHLIDHNNKASTESCEHRFSLNTQYLFLSIENVEFSDAGNYTCDIMRILPLPTTDFISHAILHVEGLSLQRLNSNKATCVHLLCSLVGLNPARVNFSWSKGQNIYHPSTSSDMSSELHLCEPEWIEGDTITCNASYLSPKILYSQSIQLTGAVAGLSLHQLNSSNATCVHLLCSLEGLNPVRVNFSWSKGQNIYPPSNSSDMSSELHLCEPEWIGGDIITCNASYLSPKILYSQSIQLTGAVAESPISESLLIITCSVVAGIIFCLIFTIVLCKCKARKKRDENGTIIFSNKIYENFSFVMARQTAQAISKPQTEECIYEN